MRLGRVTLVVTFLLLHCCGASRLSEWRDSLRLRVTGPVESQHIGVVLLANSISGTAFHRNGMPKGQRSRRP